jgi:hypothetical protein
MTFPASLLSKTFASPWRKRGASWRFSAERLASSSKEPLGLDHRPSTWVTLTPGSTRRLLTGYVKIEKIYIYFVMNTE